jgi:hypothetical protein
MISDLFESLGVAGFDHHDEPINYSSHLPPRRSFARFDLVLGGLDAIGERVFIRTTDSAQANSRAHRIGDRDHAFISLRNTVCRIPPLR